MPLQATVRPTYGEEIAQILLQLPSVCIWTMCMVRDVANEALTYIRDFLSLTTLRDIYFTPFYFQAVRDVPAIISEIRIISLCLSQTIAVVAVSAVVRSTGHYLGPPKECFDFTSWRAD